MRVEAARALITEPRILLVDRRETDDALLRLVREAFPGPVLWVMDDLDICYAAATRLALLDTGRLVGRGAAREVIERPESVEAARLVGLGNLFPAGVAALDPGPQSVPPRVRRFHADRAVFERTFEWRPRWVGIRPADVRVHARKIEADVNFVAVHLLRVLEWARTVRLEFAGGIAAEISREQFARQKDNKGWQVEFPPASLRVF